MKKLLTTGSLCCLLAGATAAPLVADDLDRGLDRLRAGIELALADEKDPPPPPGEPPRPPEADAKKTIRGVVLHFNRNPEGEVDGIVFENDQEVRFPAHMGERVTKVAARKDEIEVVVATPPARPEGEAGPRGPRQRVESIKNLKTGEQVSFAPQPRAEGSPGEPQGPRRGPADGEGPRRRPAEGEGPRGERPEGEGPRRGPDGEAGGPRRVGLQDEQMNEIRAIRKLLDLPAESEPSAEGRPAAEGERQGPPVNRITNELRELRKAIERRSSSSDRK